METGEFIQLTLNKKIAANPSYSLRALARDLDVSPSFLSQVIRGKKALSLRLARKMSRKLGLDERDHNKFLMAVAYNQLSPEVKKTLFLKKRSLATKTKYSLYDLELFNVLTNWYHVAILDLSTCDNFKSHPTWVARRLGIDQQEAQQAIERLLEIGLLKRTRKGFRKTEEKIKFPTQVSKGVIRNFHQQMIKKAADELAKTSPEEFQNREISSLTLAVNRSKVKEAQTLIENFKVEMGQLLTAGPCEEVYQFNIQLFPLTKKVD